MEKPNWLVFEQPHVWPSEWMPALPSVDLLDETTTPADSLVTPPKRPEAPN